MHQLQTLPNVMFAVWEREPTCLTPKPRLLTAEEPRGSIAMADSVMVLRGRNDAHSTTRGNSSHQPRASTSAGPGGMN